MTIPLSLTGKDSLITQLYNDVKTLHTRMGSIAKERNEALDKFKWTEDFYSKKLDSLSSDLKEKARSLAHANQDKKDLLNKVDNLGKRINMSDNEKERERQVKDQKEQVIVELTDQVNKLM